VRKKKAYYQRQVSVLNATGWAIALDPPKLVTVMAECDGYAMVRHPGCLPFVVKSKELKPFSEGDGR